MDPRENPEVIKGMLDVGGAVVLGPMPVARKLVDGTLGSMAGVSAMNADRTNLKIALNFEQKGMNPDNIYSLTGWYRGIDDQWRFELPTEQAKLKPSALEPPKYEDVLPMFREAGISLDMSYGRGNLPDSYRFRKWGTDNKDPANYIAEKDLPENLRQIAADLQGAHVPKIRGILPEYLDFPELYKAYPQFKEMKVVLTKLDKNTAEYRANEKVGEIGSIAIDLDRAKLTRHNLKELILHEVQHGIQDVERFAYGLRDYTFRKRLFDMWEKETDPVRKEEIAVLFDRAKNVGDSLADVLYNRAPGEVEARLVENRSRMSAEKRKQETPMETAKILEEDIGRPFMPGRVDKIANTWEDSIASNP